MVCSIDDIVSRRPGKHTRFPLVHSLYIYLFYFFLFFLDLIHHCASPYLCGSFFFFFTLHSSLLSCNRRTNWNFELFYFIDMLLF